MVILGLLCSVLSQGAELIVCLKDINENTVDDFLCWNHDRIITVLVVK